MCLWVRIYFKSVSFIFKNGLSLDLVFVVCTSLTMMMTLMSTITTLTSKIPISQVHTMKTMTSTIKSTKLAMVCSVTSMISSNSYNQTFSDICFLRLDFEQFQTNYVDATGVCQDFLEIATQSGINYPTLCGTLTGQHSEFALTQLERKK